MTPALATPTAPPACPKSQALHLLPPPAAEPAPDSTCPQGQAEPDAVPDAAERLAHLRGTLHLTRAGIDLAAVLAQEIHAAIAAVPLAVLEPTAIGPAVRHTHDRIRDLVYGCVRRVNDLLFGTLDRALARTAPALAPPAALPSELVGLLHGVLGDRLTRNPMRTAMQLRHRGARLKLGRRALARAFPRPGDRLVVFVHGLAADETSWRRGSERAWGRPDLDYGALLAERSGVTPLYLRYNSGLRVSANGRALAGLLRRLVAAYPVPPRAIVLVGHSMGGLVVRSACHHGQRRGDDWAGRVTDVVCLGAPHRGAALEKFGVAAVAALAGFGVTAPLARAIDLRSAGIKDLRRGEAHADEAVLPRARYHDLAGTLGHPDHPLAWALGDGLVRVTSAAPTDRPGTHRTILPGVGHIAMLAHPDVLDRLTAILGES